MDKARNIDHAARFLDPNYLQEDHAGEPDMEAELLLSFMPGKVAVISRDLRSLKPLLDVTLQHGLSIDQLVPSAFVQKKDSFTEEEWTYVIVSLDDNEDIGSLLDQLLRFRRASPKTPVMLVSTNFSRDDLTCERLPICDVSLRASLKAVHINKALAAAFMNNIRWQTRISDLCPSEQKMILPEKSEDILAAESQYSVID